MTLLEGFFPPSYIFRFISVVRRKTIYEYHRVDLKEIDIDAKSAIYFEALETCNRKTSCEECLGDQSIKLLGVSPILGV